LSSSFVPRIDFRYIVTKHYALLSPGHRIYLFSTTGVKERSHYEQISAEEILGKRERRSEGNNFHVHHISPILTSESQSTGQVQDSTINFKELN
jgi:hypothetical protein